jgi:hypothetical protein
MSFTSDKFIINGVNSSDIGVDGCYLIRRESEINRQIMGQRSVVKDTIRYKSLPYFYTTEQNVIEFDLKFSLLEGEFTEDKLYEISSLFSKNNYVEFRSIDYPGVVFFVIATSIELITFGSFQGYLQIHLENCAGHAFSEMMVSTFYFSSLTTPQIFEIDAKFNVPHPKHGFYYYPELLIDMKGSATAITIIANSDAGRNFGFTNLTPLENLVIDNELKQIISSTDNYRLSNMINSHAWFRLIQNHNIFTVNAPSIIQIKARYPLYI